MDLNIDNYSLSELLKLFKLHENFTASEFKEAKKIAHKILSSKIIVGHSLKHDFEVLELTDI